jgi:hypothetical protein
MVVVVRSTLGGDIMRCALAPLVLLASAVAHGADDAPKVSGTLDGKSLTFPEKGVADGVKATLGLLESCHSESLYEADERTKAEQGDYIRLVFAKPVEVTVMEETFDVAELVFRRPQNTGVFWVRRGDTWRRFSKYEPAKEEPFEAWLRQGQPAD